MTELVSCAKAVGADSERHQRKELIPLVEQGVCFLLRNIGSWNVKYNLSKRTGKIIFFLGFLDGCVCMFIFFLASWNPREVCLTFVS